MFFLKTLEQSTIIMRKEDIHEVVSIGVKDFWEGMLWFLP